MRGIIATGTAAMLLGGCAQADPMLAACEESVKKRLASPATYQRINFVPSSKEIPLSEIPYETANSIALQTAAGRKGRLFTIHLTYDAQNRMGVPLRSTVACTYATTANDASNAAEVSVKVNGKTSIEWMIEQIKR